MIDALLRKERIEAELYKIQQDDFDSSLAVVKKSI